MTRTTTPVPALAQRLVSLDVFRGITMASMVIVNNPGDWGNAYWPLLHAEWNGWTPTDLIFPFFLFMVGVSMTLSKATTGPGWRIVRRGVMIMALGWFLGGFPYFDLTKLRLPGVLVRIGLCYLAAAGIFRLTLPRGDRDDRRHARRLGAWVAGLTLGYWALMVLMPYPGHAPGDLTPAGNLGAFIDRALLGRAHMWGRRPWDPEGLLSTLPAIATTLMGLMTGFWLRAPAEGRTKALLMAAAGIAAMAIGALWDLAFPINKNLWTSSYVFFTGGAGMAGLAACYWVIDVEGWRWWTKPFVILGVNAIALFMLAGLSAKLLILIKMTDAAGKRISLQSLMYARGYEPFLEPKNASLLFALTYVVALYLVLWLMYRRRIFLKV
ncbi:MAG TPA: heparan-alpha-glucosaminide N-acetyltransferase domain-containing protein [Vicinamibacterales bacterium]|jgi:predicted acyltransferase